MYIIKVNSHSSMRQRILQVLHRLGTHIWRTASLAQHYIIRNWWTKGMGFETASQADSLPSGPLGNPGEPPTNECLSSQVLSSRGAYMSTALPFAWKARCVCTQSTLWPAESSSKACYFFFLSPWRTLWSVYIRSSLSNRIEMNWRKQLFTWWICLLCPRPVR